jgi:hypothetical protein
VSYLRRKQAETQPTTAPSLDRGTPSFVNVNEITVLVEKTTFEKHYRVGELAGLWGLGRETRKTLIASAMLIRVGAASAAGSSSGGRSATRPSGGFAGGGNSLGLFPVIMAGVLAAEDASGSSARDNGAGAMFPAATAFLELSRKLDRMPRPQPSPWTPVELQTHAAILASCTALHGEMAHFL